MFHKRDIFFSVHKPKLKFLNLNELDLSLNVKSSRPNNPQHYHWLKQAAEWAENKWGYMRKFLGLEERITLIQKKIPHFYLAFYEDQDKNLHLVGTFALTPDELDIKDEQEFIKKKKYYVRPLQEIQTMSLSYLYVHDNFRDFGFGTQILDKAKEIAKESKRLMTAHLLSSTVHGFYKKRNAIFVEDHHAIKEPCAQIYFEGSKP